MKIILCPKEKGNTRKICEEIAKEDNWKLITITGNESIDISKYDCVILASGVYGGLPHKNLLTFIRNLKEEYKPKKFNLLLTWLGRGKSDQAAYNRLEKECSNKNILISSDYKKTLGRAFGVIHNRRPNNQDIESCIKWANELKD